MDDAAARPTAEAAAPRTGRLESLAPGQAIPFGGDRVAYVSEPLAKAFQPGDRLVVVQETGDLLHVPAVIQTVAADAVGRAHGAFQALGATSDQAITDFFQAFAANLADDAVWSAIGEANVAGEVSMRVDTPLTATGGVDGAYCTQSTRPGSANNTVVRNAGTFRLD